MKFNIGFLALMAEMLSPTSNKVETVDEPIIPDLKSEKRISYTTPERSRGKKKQLPKGHRYFEVNGKMIPALNMKNAIRKAGKQ